MNADLHSIVIIKTASRILDNRTKKNVRNYLSLTSP